MKVEKGTSALASKLTQASTDCANEENLSRHSVLDVPTWLQIGTLLFFLCLSFGGVVVAQTVEPTEPHSAAAGSTFVHTAFGGFILGYDIDETGTEGILAEALTLPNGHHDVAVETFDQTTGEIIKIVVQQTDSENDFVTLGIFGHRVGLVEYEHTNGGFVDRRSYRAMNPLNLNRFTQEWTPPLKRNEILLGMARSQGGANTAVLAFENGGNARTILFSSDVAANTFGPRLTLTDPNFSFTHSPMIAYDSIGNRAVLATLGDNAFGPPTIARVNLATGGITEFTGVGIGYVNGIAVDPETSIACTTTEIDFSVEFYDLTNQVGFVVPLPGAVSQAQSGADVQFDPIHKLFLVAQPLSSTAGSGSSIQVFDEQGRFIESINGLNLPVSPVLIALHPSKRFGYVLVTPNLTELQSFTY